MHYSVEERAGGAARAASYDLIEASHRAAAKAARAEAASFAATAARCDADADFCRSVAARLRRSAAAAADGNWQGPY